MGFGMLLMLPGHGIREWLACRRSVPTRSAMSLGHMRPQSKSLLWASNGLGLNQYRYFEKWIHCLGCRYLLDKVSGNHCP